MVTQTPEAPSLFPSRRDNSGPPEKGLHGYWRKSNGWIITGNMGTPANRSHFEQKGYEALPKYGQFMPGTSGGDAREGDVNGAPWNPADEPWRLIFQKGGAHEFPVDQIVAFQWHIKPPYREVEFPQLQGVGVTDLPCPECDRIMSSRSEGEAAQMLKSHLTTRVDAKHSYTVADLKALGEEWGLNLETARTRMVRRSVKEAIREEAQSLTPEPAGPDLQPGEAKLNEEYRCQDCGEWAPPITSKNPSAALRMHRRSHDREG